MDEDPPAPREVVGAGGLRPGAGAVGGPDVARVAVTWDDIRRGVRHSCGSCALARVMNRATGLRWLVGPLTAMLAGDHLVRVLLPPEAVDWLDYARGRPWREDPPLRPVAFEVRYAKGGGES